MFQQRKKLGNVSFKMLDYENTLFEDQEVQFSNHKRIEQQIVYINETLTQRKTYILRYKVVKTQK